MPILIPEDPEFARLETEFAWFENVLACEYGEEGWEDATTPDALNWLALVPESIRFDFEETECNLAFADESYRCTFWEAFPGDDEDAPLAVFLVDDYGVRLLAEYSVLNDAADAESVSETMRRAQEELPDRLLAGEFHRSGEPIMIPDTFRVRAR